jgi:hypothetical protein
MNIGVASNGIKFISISTKIAEIVKKLKGHQTHRYTHTYSILIS